MTSHGASLHGAASRISREERRRCPLLRIREPVASPAARHCRAKTSRSLRSDLFSLETNNDFAAHCERRRDVKTATRSAKKQRTTTKQNSAKRKCLAASRRTLGQWEPQLKRHCIVGGVYSQLSIRHQTQT